MTSDSFRNKWWSLALCGIAIFMLYFISRIFIFDRFIIPTWSMAPTLVPGDRVVVNKLLMGARLYTDFDFKQGGQELKSIRMKGLRKLHYNDVVVFNYPQVGGRIAFKINYVYCKRCVALPGDTLYVENGHYRCNNYRGALGLQSEQDRLETSLSDTDKVEIYMPYEQVGWTLKQLGPLYIPRENDIIALTPKEATIYKSLIEYETGKKVTVDREGNRVFLDNRPITEYQWRHNYYFMAGDNVCDSIDSRYWGLVPEDYIVGVVTMISYSKDRETDEIKWERVLLAI